MTIEADIISPVDCVRNLGVHMDQHLTMTHRVTAVCAACNYHLYRLSSIRHYLTTEATKSAVNALVTSRLDYCNSLLVNLPASQILQLQRVQNNAARLITRTSRHDHITPVLRGLHWLPVASRIHFKLLVLAYQCVNGLAPTWRITKKSIGESAFGTTAPRLWNSLPADIRNSKTLNIFRKSLKTHLFISHFKYM